MRIQRALIAFVGLCASEETALGADKARTPEPAVTLSASNIWDGVYVGGAAGFAFGRTSWVQDGTIHGSFNLNGEDGQFGPAVGSLEAGFNHVFASGLLLGLNADFNFPDYEQTNPTPVMGATGPILRENHIEIFGGVRGRAGYAFGNWLVYAQGGFAYDHDYVEDTYASGNTDDVYFWRPGWTVGAGVAAKLDAHWSARLEYNFLDFASSQIYLPFAAQSYSSDLKLHQFRVGLDYHFAADDEGSKMPNLGIVPDMSRWSLHGQTTLIGQGAAPFSAAYTGPFSLNANGEMRESWSMTGFFGWKVLDHTEIYFNPEPFQGFGLSQTHGLGGFSNGEAQKAGFDFPHYNTSRLFVRQTFGFGGEQEELEDAANQVAGKTDISRLTLTAGKFSVTDIFDTNSYSHDPRTSFMNLALMDGGAFDYAADLKGYTWGVAAELNQKDWAVRTGYFLEPDSPNNNNFDTRLGQRGQYVGEVEGRYQLFSQTGKIRLTGWLNRVFSGSFSETLANPYLNPLTAPSDSPGIAATRKTRTEYGFVANLEQPITDDIGVFARLSWRNAQTEIMSWTDIDRSASAGVIVDGTSWKRPDDKIGAAFAINGLSDSYQAFLAAGGLGLQIGDGRLSYQTEKIIETFYTYNLSKWANLTFDYQFIADPGYNADRGPVSIGSIRLHLEF